jgi:hypothetical protein
MWEVSRGTAYGVGFSQFAVTIAAVAFFPPVDVDIYLVKGRINITSGGFSIDQRDDVDASKVFMAFPTLLCSLFGVGFSFVTYQGFESGLAGQDYNPDALDTVAMWNVGFWFYCLFAHGIVVFTVADPVDLFGAGLSTCFMVYFLYRVCAPKPGGSVNLTRENMNILGYGAGVALMAYQVTSIRPYGAYVVMLTLILDYFLGLGHTYDREATLETVANCRLFYVCAASLSIAFLYAMSGGETSHANSSPSIHVLQ